LPTGDIVANIMTKVLLAVLFYKFQGYLCLCLLYAIYSLAQGEGIQSTVSSTLELHT